MPCHWPAGICTPVAALDRVEEVASGLSAEIIVEDYVHFATEDYVCFCGMSMAVNGQRSAGKQHVD